jgi:putative DNA modification/repair radical SAM protein
MDLMEKLKILADAAKYDSACSSTGSNRASKEGMIGKTGSCIVHSYASDGRTVSLLKVLMSNYCQYDCKYCVNRASNDPPRAVFTPDELASLTITFYKRNFVDGLFLSSGVLKSPDYTMELMYAAIKVLRNEYRFNGYVHVKTIPGASNEIITKMGLIVDRLSVNIELPSENSLKLLAPNKEKNAIINPMKHIHETLQQNKREIISYKHAPAFSPAGQATQLIIGATPETDYQIVRLSESLYNKYRLRRVYYTAYMPVGTSALLPKYEKAPLLREHRLYQCDWMIRFYGYKSHELLSEQKPHLDLLLDPKCNWAMSNLGVFPIEVNTAPRELLLRVPGIGQIGAAKILKTRRLGSLDFDALKKMSIVLKRAVYFITCNGRVYENVNMNEKNIYKSLVSPNVREQIRASDQLSLFDLPVATDDIIKSLTGEI